MLFVSGTAETRELKDMMPDILKQVGPKQYQYLKSQLVGGEAKEGEDDDDDVPNLVGNFDGSKWEQKHRKVQPIWGMRGKVEKVQQP